MIWLIDTVYSAGHIKMAEIDRKWARSAYNDAGEEEYGARNLHRHREAIAALFGIEIVCDRTTNEYSIGSRGAMDGDGARAWLVNTFAVNNMVNLAGGMKDRIIFEDIPEGARYLSTIVNAMKEELKVFKQRWYLVGKPEDHPEESEPRVYALDRMKDLVATDKPYNMPKDFKASLFFQGQYGIDRSITKPEKIVVKVTNYDANFMRSLPLHPSQVEMRHDDEFTYFSFFVSPTYDFIMELRKFGSKLEVLEPASLRKDFIDEIEDLRKLYKQNADLN